MKNSATTAGRADEGDDLNAFANEITLLCRKYGLALAGQPEVFVMDRDDYQLSYHVDDKSRLVLS